GAGQFGGAGRARASDGQPHPLSPRLRRRSRRQVVPAAVETLLVPVTGRGDVPERFFEAVETLPGRREVEAEHVVLLFHPAGAEAEREPPTGDLVDGHTGFEEHGGVAEG